MIIPPRRSTASQGLLAAGDNDYVITNTVGTRLPPLIYCHGAGVWTEYLLSPSAPNQWDLVEQLSRYFTVFVSDFAGDAWGNDSAVARVGAAKTWMETNLGTSGPVTMVGVSMGNITQFAYARANPTDVRSICGIIPACDTQDLYTSRGYSTSITAAYPGGGTPWNTNTKNPVLIAPYLPSNLPIRLFYSITDATTVYSTVSALNSARSQTTITNIGNNGHSDASILDAMVAGVIEYCRFNALPADT